MSLFTTLNVGASGLGVASTGLGVAGDNIANVGTTGYKQARATFADFMPQDVFGYSGMGQLGTGAATNFVANMFGQGTLEDTQNPLDMAITGTGFFVVNNGQRDYFTRAGEFYLDDEGYIVTAAGMRLQGHNADNGALSAAIDDLRIPSAVLPGIATTELVMEAQLSAETAVGADLAAMDFFGTGTGANTIQDAGEVADFSTSTTVYDSLGVAHEVTVFFERSTSTDWIWRAVVDASEAYDATGTQFSTNTGDAFEIATGTLTFDTAGELITFAQTDTSTTTPWTFEAAAASTIAFDFGLDALGVATDGSLLMAGNESSVSAISQDGRTTGNLLSLDVDDDGVISGVYSNGEEVVLAQVLLATFKAQNGLVKAGGTLFEETIDSGPPALDVAGTGGRGTISGYALEKSNVTLEDEFVNMITAQRSYQASAKVVTTADSSLQTLLNMV